jgi:chromosome segregation ATPase
MSMFDATDTANSVEQLSALCSQVESLSRDLLKANEMILSKNEELSKLNAELNDIKTRNTAVQDVDAVNAIEQLTKQSEDVECIRSHVMTLAIALERSENRRAEAIDRLLSERQANADSLRRLSESVKRFYSSLSLGEV